MAKMTATGQDLVISCQNITKIYGHDLTSVTVLKDVSLNIKVGEFVAIIGPSGSGKSTLMHILGALDTPSNGSYKLNGKDVSSLSDDELADIRGRTIGFVFQSFNLLPRTSVMRNVQLPLIYDKGTKPDKRKSLAESALLSAGLDKALFDNKSNQLSGGQIQRVAIARALVNDPAIILADEPTGNLDQATGGVVLETFQRLHKEGRTIILITHDMNVALHANRIIQIRDGEIVSDNINNPKRKVLA